MSPRGGGTGVVNDPVWAGPALILLAVLLQVQLTLPVGEVGLRVSAADTFLPVLLLAAALHMRPWAARLATAAWRLPAMWLWLLALSLWLAVALVRGLPAAGGWSTWALVNKFGGWFVLVSFLLLGWWAGGALPAGRRSDFLKAWFGAGWTIAAGAVALYAGYKFGLVHLRDSHDLAQRVQGLLGNPNAFGCFLGALAVLQAPFARRGLLLPPSVHRLGMTIALVGLILSGSRTAWVATAAGFLALHVLKELDWRELARAAVLAGLVTLVLYFGRPAAAGLYDLVSGASAPTGAETLSTALRSAYAFRAHPAGLVDRMQSVGDVLRLWVEDPLLGAGLGAALQVNLADRPGQVTLIHSTALWLLAETGVVGLGLFAAFFALSARAVWRARLGRPDDPFLSGVLAVLALFAAASFGMEALYQRHLWFLLGMALAVPPGSTSEPRAEPKREAAPRIGLAAAPGGRTGVGRAGRIGLVLALLAVGLLAAFKLMEPLERSVEAAAILGDIAAGRQATVWKRMTAAPRKRVFAYEADGRRHAGDLYEPGSVEVRSGVVVVPGALRAGKDDPRLVALAETLARARFLVLVPDIPTVRELKLRAADSLEIADAARALAQLRPGGHPRVGVIAFSYAAGPALLAALDPSTAEPIRFILAVGGYRDSTAVLTFFTTGFYRDGDDGPWRHREPNAYGKWLFLRSNLEWVEDGRDRALLERMAARKLEDLGADISGLASGLGPEGRSVLDFIENTDPERVRALLAALPERVKAEIAALDLKDRDLSQLRARLVLVHGRDDAIIPESESRSLFAAAPPGRADLYVVDRLAHVDLGEIGVRDALVLWQAVYRLLELRDRVV